ncbi:MAG: glycosyltransferase [Acidiphilium sp.]
MLSSLAIMAAIIWLYLVFGHGERGAPFWHSTPELLPAWPVEAPPVDIIVPARDEAETIAPVIASLLAQDYPGSYRVILVDDGSADDTKARARLMARHDPRFLLVEGAEKPAGWAGKLFALEQGVAQSSAPLILFTDADITHDPRHLATLVARLHAPVGHYRLDMVSEMVRLNCTSLAERLLIPAFVYFFQMLYPFAQVNNPLSAVAAAAGGTVLIRRTALTRIGGIRAMRGALIDDVTLARAVKPGGAIFLGHSGLAQSIRLYPQLADIRAMIARSAFTQLRHSSLLLALTVLGLGLVWLVPPLAVLAGHGLGFVAGLVASGLAIWSYLPTLRRYRVSRLWALALPLIAVLYLEATIASARRYWRGAGAQWKRRDYGAA